MDINEAIHKVEGELAHTMQELAATRELLTMLEDGRKKLELELHGLRSFAQRAGELSGEPAAPRHVSSHPDHADVVPISGTLQLATTANTGLGPVALQALSRTDAVIAVMSASTGPLDRAAIHEQLFHGGREDDTIDDVSLTLSGLKRSKRVERLGKGLWQLVVLPTPHVAEDLDRLRSIES